ncbi:Hypothetical_protein [Hexamita inflata]|uniref:Hypothetical_protein n=1 Tax=Hexamita inflata TaxID=28002 RepID=A0ABP1I7H0_9EUKA
MKTQFHKRKTQSPPMIISFRYTYVATTWVQTSLDATVSCKPGLCFDGFCIQLIKPQRQPPSNVNTTNQLPMQTERNNEQITENREPVSENKVCELASELTLQAANDSVRVFTEWAQMNGLSPF